MRTEHVCSCGIRLMILMALLPAGCDYAEGSDSFPALRGHPSSRHSLRVLKEGVQMILLPVCSSLLLDYRS